MRCQWSPEMYSQAHADSCMLCAKSLVVAKGQAVGVGP